MNIEEAVSVVRSGGVIIYPTETLYAIGADATDEHAAKRVALVKGRPVSKPLPLIIGDMDQLDMVTGSATPEILRLARRFWPGPLSIVVEARAELPNEVKDAQGFTSVRWTDHPIARKLCLTAHCPLIATSANKSGEVAAATPDEIDTELASRVEGVITERPLPRGGDPSTVVRALPGGKVRIIRYGVISRAALVQAGFSVLD